MTEMFVSRLSRIMTRGYCVRLGVIAQRTRHLQYLIKNGRLFYLTKLGLLFYFYLIRKLTTIVSNYILDKFN